MRFVVLAASLLLISSGPALASGSAVVGLFADPAGLDPLIVDSGPGLVEIYVVVVLTPGATAVQFSAPIPECFTGAAYLGDTPNFPVTIGSSQTGVAVGFGSCLAAPIHVLTINVLAEGLTDSCCFYPLLPDPNAPSGEVEVVDCNANIVAATGLTSIVSPGGFFPPWVGDPDPPDGAIERPVDTNLRWRIETCSIGLGVVWSDVFFGTSPDPPLVGIMLDDLTFDPGLLSPATTYYWKVRVVDTDAGTTVSPVWTFTTIEPVAEEQTTWGRIKTLFR